MRSIDLQNRLSNNNLDDIKQSLQSNYLLSSNHQIQSSQFQESQLYDQPLNNNKNVTIFQGMVHLNNQLTVSFSAQSSSSPPDPTYDCTNENGLNIQNGDENKLFVIPRFQKIDEKLQFSVDFQFGNQKQSINFDIDIDNNIYQQQLKQQQQSQQQEVENDNVNQRFTKNCYCDCSCVECLKCEMPMHQQRSASSMLELSALSQRLLKTKLRKDSCNSDLSDITQLNEPFTRPQHLISENFIQSENIPHLNSHQIKFLNFDSYNLEQHEFISLSNQPNNPPQFHQINHNYNHNINNNNNKNNNQTTNLNRLDDGYLTNENKKKRNYIHLETQTQKYLQCQIKHKSDKSCTFDSKKQEEIKNHEKQLPLQNSQQNQNNLKSEINENTNSINNNLSYHDLFSIIEQELCGQIVPPSHQPNQPTIQNNFDSQISNINQLSQNKMNSNSDNINNNQINKSENTYDNNYNMKKCQIRGQKINDSIKQQIIQEKLNKEEQLEDMNEQDSDFLQQFQENDNIEYTREYLAKAEKKNVVKNFVKAFKSYLNENTNEKQLMQILEIKNNKELDIIKSKFTMYLKKKKFNNKLIKDLLQNKCYNKIFAFWLINCGKAWLQQHSKVENKQSHLIMLHYFILCIDSPEQLDKLKVLKNNNKKTISTSFISTPLALTYSDQQQSSSKNVLSSHQIMSNLEFQDNGDMINSQQQSQQNVSISTFNLLPNI